jgi:Spx/MgsR family transcriptional regulator
MMFGIKNCDTVKKARLYLAQQQVPVEFHDYKTSGVPVETLKAAAAELGWDALINRKGTTWRKLTPQQQQLQAEADYLALCQAEPSVIKRPLLQHNGQFTSGFTAEQYAKIFGAA